MNNSMRSILQQFFCTSTDHLDPATAEKLTRQFVRADRTMLLLIIAYWLILATLGGLRNDHYLLGYIGGGLAVAIGLTGYHFYRGTYINRILTGCVGCLVEVIYIQQELGSPSAHLVYFLSLGFLLLYRDGFAAASSLALLIIHHFTATWCESAGITLFDVPVLAFNWGRWDAFATHFYWAVLMAVLLCLVTYNSMIEFLDSEKTIHTMEAVNRQLNERVAQREHLLSRTANEIETIFATLSEAVLAITRDKTIHPHYSAWSEQLLETTDIAGQAAMSVIFANSNLTVDILAQQEAALDACLGQSPETFALHHDRMIRQCRWQSTINGLAGKKHLEFLWQPIINEQQRIESILVSITDITELRQLEALTSREKLNLKMLSALLPLEPNQFFTFVAGAEAQLLGCELLLQGIDHDAKTTVQSLSQDDKALRLQTIRHQLNALQQQSAGLELGYLTSSITAAANYCDAVPDSNSLDARRIGAELENAQQLLRDYVSVSQENLNWHQQHNSDGLSINKQQAQALLERLMTTDTTQIPQMMSTLTDIRDYLTKSLKADQANE